MLPFLVIGVYSYQLKSSGASAAAGGYGSAS